MTHLSDLKFTIAGWDSNTQMAQIIRRATQETEERFGNFDEIPSAHGFTEPDKFYAIHALRAEWKAAYYGRLKELLYESIAAGEWVIKEVDHRPGCGLLVGIGHERKDNERPFHV